MKSDFIKDSIAERYIFKWARQIIVEVQLGNQANHSDF